ncbi:unnamed protein product (mitochondrion) [Plasmodiophora brassicae]|uniref:Myb-like domain-containing protein n=1 Tax=Plasmodiophora brassicae TaxID=37360 RepID=A0A0G4J8U4_PLABS|nr:hypothetical protein PBRA_003391 [Plasmodiophora brassicae]SPQ99742.1 unnamed protein product [Plasmodiophora brassicae]
MASVIRRSSSRTVAFSPASSIAATAELHHVLRALSDADYAAVNGNASDGWTRSATQALVDAVMAGRDCGDVDGLPFSAAECRARFERVSAALVTAKRRLDFDGEKSGASANPSAAWPPARQKAWAALATDPNAYYMKWGKPGVAVDEGEWRPDELGLFDKLMKERPPLGQWGLFSLYFPTRTGAQCKKLFETRPRTARCQTLPTVKGVAVKKNKSKKRSAGSKLRPAADERRMPSGPEQSPARPVPGTPQKQPSCIRRVPSPPRKVRQAPSPLEQIPKRVRTIERLGEDAGEVHAGLSNAKGVPPSAPTKQCPAGESDPDRYRGCPVPPDAKQYGLPPKCPTAARPGSKRVSVLPYHTNDTAGSGVVAEKVPTKTAIRGARPLCSTSPVPGREPEQTVPAQGPVGSACPPVRLLEQLQAERANLELGFDNMNYRLISSYRASLHNAVGEQARNAVRAEFLQQAADQARLQTIQSECLACMQRNRLLAYAQAGKFHLPAAAVQDLTATQL